MDTSRFEKTPEEPIGKKLIERKKDVDTMEFHKLQLYSAMVELEKHYEFMRYALRLANNALHTNEVPVACVFVYDGQIISYGSNNTNDSLSGITHAEFRGINIILDKVKSSPDFQQVYQNPQDIFQDIDLYVTVEPCVMCASALKQIGIRSVFFGCGNERFGGNGSVLRINKDCTTPENNYNAFPGFYRREAILLLRDFYTHENTHAPVPKSKKNRNLNKETYPDLIWSNYLNKDEFISMFGEDKIEIFEENRDLIEEVDESVLDPNNIDISDIIEFTETPLSSFKRRKL